MERNKKFDDLFVTIAIELINDKFEKCSGRKSMEFFSSEVDEVLKSIGRTDEYLLNRVMDEI